MGFDSESIYSMIVFGNTICSVFGNSEKSSKNERKICLDKEIKEFILNLDDADPRLSYLAVYRLQPLLKLRSKQDEREKFWRIIKAHNSQLSHRAIL